MDTNATIRMLNTITAEHFTSGGCHMPRGDRDADSVILAAWYARSALDNGRELDKRVCDLLRAKEEIGKVDQHRLGGQLGQDLSDFWNVLNAIAWATSLVCDDIRSLELLKAKRRK